MKGFFNWFKSSTKMKRWIFLILLGIILTCYGLAQLLVLKVITITELIKVIISFVIGFVLVIIGLVFSQKRTLELLVEATDYRMNSKDNVNLKSLIFNKKIYNDGPKIVVIGGGTGLDMVLEGLKEYTNNLTAIVTISDYGEIPTDSRKELELLPFDDIKNSIASLSLEEGALKNLFDYEFDSRKLKGLNFGDIYLSATKEIYGDIAEAIKSSSKTLNIIGKVLPVTLDEMTICAELENGEIIEEKSKIAEEVLDKFSRIHRIFINPTNCRVAPGVLEAIQEADAIIIGPGSLYTNVIPNLLIKGVAKEIKESKAIKIYISNIMTEPGQTDNYTLSQHIDAITEHAGKAIVDYCICDTEELVPEFVKKYNAKGADIVDTDISKVKDVKVLQRKISYIKEEFIRHNPKIVAQSIIEIICDDLKYQDKQNDSQYLRLNAKLREERIKKENRKSIFNFKKKSTNKTNQNPITKNVTRKKKESKFNKKYKDRIKSIQESEKTRQKNIKQMEKNKKQREKKTNQKKQSKSKH